MEVDSSKWTCHECGSTDFFIDDDEDGFIYCQTCSIRDPNYIPSGVAEENFVNCNGGSAIYGPKHSRHHNAAKPPEPISQSQFYDGPSDFGSGLAYSSSEDYYYSELRMNYVKGVQRMIQMQCEYLIKELKVSPLICGISGTIWLRFLASTRVFDDGWADQMIHDSEESHKHGDSEHYSKSCIKHSSSEPQNIYGERAIMIWYRSLRKSIPLSCSLAICFLSCHVAREPVLPTDMLKLSLEGKLPYLAAFVDIAKEYQLQMKACPLSSSSMFRPSQLVPLQKLESLAATIAKSIGLDLPPVNFYEIASRYLMQLSLSSEEKILSYACRINEWTTSPDLWLSTSELRLPTRVCVMSILILAIRILYNINGFGFWEMSLSSPMSGSCSSPDSAHGLAPTIDSEMMVENDSSYTRLDAAKLLHNLYSRIDDAGDTSEYSEDLPTYLQYCKDVAFAGLEPPFEDHEEKNIIQQLWDFFQKQKDSDPTEDLKEGIDTVLKRCRDDGSRTSQNMEIKKMKRNSASLVDDSLSGSLNGYNSTQSLHCSQNSEYSVQSKLEGQNYERAKLDCKEQAIGHLKANMEENMFCYIPPRANVKRLDYLHYIRKRDDGSMTYVAHADYYILLCACARVAQVDIRSMHIGVLSFERRLAWTESRIDQCIALQPPDVPCDL